MLAGVTLKAFLRDTSGATSIEYALIASGISIAILGTVTIVGGKVLAMFTTVKDALN
ncbi:MAG: Flp pilus assembly protein, pilin Flp [Pseudolabrys sp.]|jgi:pilus assembly protein Flp/PilA|nr:Flp pilus assembly protein, pilin Flp [Pseudolabrys sp.]